MPHRIHISIAEALWFDSRLSRHALARPPKENMQREAQAGPTAARDPQTAATSSERGVSDLSSSFERTLIAASARPPRPWLPLDGRGTPAFWTPFPRYPGPPRPFLPYYVPSLIRGRGFHTTSCYSPQFPNERHAVMQSREAAPGVKRRWEEDRRASYSGDRNRSQHAAAAAEERKRHHRSESCGELGRSRRLPELTEADVRADVRRLRRWEYTKFGRDHKVRPKPGLEFSVVTYNVLAQCLLQDNGYLYRHCDPGVLPWDYRKVRILKELTEANADVLCLQEIQCDHYEDFFVPELGKLGYAGRYKKRTGDKNDGCAIFFKGDLFTLDSCASVEYSRPELSVLDRDNIALVAMLRSRRGRGKVCVANTHLLFNPGRGDIKLAQLQILLAEIDRFAYNHHHRRSQHSGKPLYHPVILCGDMNSEPNCSLYELVSTGALRYEGLIAGDISGQAEGCHKGRFALVKELIPERLGISDQCQYVDAISKRSGGAGRRCGDGPGEDNRPGPQPEKSGSAPSHEDDRAASTSRSEAASVFATGKMSHGLNFVSAYGNSIDRARGRPAAVTTHHKKGSCMVDYIFYTVRSKNSQVKKLDGGQRVEHWDTKDGPLSLIATYGLLTCEELTRLGGLPNCALPSDHLALVAKFLLRDDS